MFLSITQQTVYLAELTLLLEDVGDNVCKEKDIRDQTSVLREQDSPCGTWVPQIPWPLPQAVYQRRRSKVLWSGRRSEHTGLPEEAGVRSNCGWKKKARPLWTLFVSHSLGCRLVDATEWGLESSDSIVAKIRKVVLILVSSCIYGCLPWDDHFLTRNPGICISFKLVASLKGFRIITGELRSSYSQAFTKNNFWISRFSNNTVVNVVNELINAQWFFCFVTGQQACCDKWILVQVSGQTDQEIVHKRNDWISGLMLSIIFYKA